MVARLAKNVHGGRRRDVPELAIADELNALNRADVGVTLSPNEGALATSGCELDLLFAALAAVTPESHPRTARLLAAGTRKVAQKVIEEAGEVALATVKHNGGGIVRESADLLYHLAVLWRRAGIAPADVWAEMRRRADDLGIAEKLPKSNS
jgi:phosphoribosyl-ATP pyrophosphohydrolase